jgi:hypothetical protein
MGDWPLLPVVLAAVLVFGGNWSFRTIAQGWTQRRAERAICFRDRWGRIANEEVR